ncbi:MAG: hypothetical protein FJY26_05750 [Betaproteobacteria bacterium]|nr:hypothetical protein [Betaproteobacteria bacterium]
MPEALSEPRASPVWPGVHLCATNWDAAYQHVGLAGFRFHDLRHKWAAWHARAGTPLPVLQELAGWHSTHTV